MAQVCVPEGQHCYDCDAYRGAFACIEKVKISDMATATELEIEAALDSECERILVPVEFVPCNGTPYTQNIDLRDIVGTSGGGNPLGATFWTPIDFGNIYSGCWYKFNTDLVITRADFADFFTAAGIAGDSFTIPGMQGKLPMGAGNGYCTNQEIVGTANSEVTIGCENLPACQIQINDPGHSHVTRLQTNRNADDGNDYLTIDLDDIGGDYLKDRTSFPSATGISAVHKVGQSGNGTPTAISVKPWSICGSWYIRLSNNCS